jgi:hypothetical protein
MSFKPYPDPEPKPNRNNPDYDEKPNNKPANYNGGKRASEDHFGMRILTSQTTAMVFTVIAILFQACMFGLLEKRVSATVDIHIHLFFGVLMGIVFETSGIMIAANFNNKKIKVGNAMWVSARGIWLFVFFFVQVLTDFSLFGIMELFGLDSGVVGKIIVCVSLPIGILGYGNLFIGENRNN